jgi:hypothetical protein
MSNLLYHMPVSVGPGDSWPVSSLTLQQTMGEGEILAA